MNFFLTSICHFLSHIYFKKYKTNCPNGAHYHLDISHRKNSFSLSHPFRKWALHCPQLIFSTFFIIWYWWWYTLLKWWLILNMLMRDWINFFKSSVDKNRQPETIVPVSKNSWEINQLKQPIWSLFLYCIWVRIPTLSVVFDSHHTYEASSFMQNKHKHYL